MQFLGILTKFFGDDAQVQGALTNGFRTILYAICTAIYKLIIFAYDLFDRISTAQILNNDAVEAIYRRVGLILGIFMLFKLTFSFIQMLIDLGSVSDKEKGLGGIIKKALIVIVLMGSINFIFKEAYTIQNIAMGKSSVNDQNMIARLLIPEQSVSASGGDFGTMLSYNLLTSFYHLSDKINYSELKDNDDYKNCFNWMQDDLENGTGSIFYYDVINNNDFETGYNCLNTTAVYKNDDGTGEKQATYLMEFDGLIAVVVGAVTLWMLITYVYSAGVRVIQLAFLQIIAPIPIMSYLSPKRYDNTMLSKWVKMCLNIYLDLFIRVAVINLVVYLITAIMSQNITNAFLTTTYYNSSTSWMKSFLMSTIILALLGFANRAPALIKELFPSTSKYQEDLGIGLKSRAPLGKAISATAGAAVGATVGFVAGARNLFYQDSKKTQGITTGAIRGAIQGIRGGISSNSSFNGIYNNATETGQTSWGYNNWLRFGGNSGGGTSNNGNPGGGTPNNGNPGGGTSNNGNPGGGTSNNGNPGGGTPNNGNPGGGTSNNGNPGGETPNNGNPGGETPNNGNPGGGTPNNGNNESGNLPFTDEFTEFNNAGDEINPIDGQHM